MADTRPLSERLAAEIRGVEMLYELGADEAWGALLPILREAAAVAARVETAPVVDLDWSTFNRGLFVGDTAEDAYAYEQAMDGKRVALVEVGE